VKKEGVEAKGWELDATDEDAVEKAINEVEEQLGPIGVLVNCAGIVGSRPIFMEQYKKFLRTLEINTGAVSLRSDQTEIDDSLHVEGPAIDEAAQKGRDYQHRFQVRKSRSPWRCGLRDKQSGSYPCRGMHPMRNRF
jgi:short chain dehydrogenase